MPDFLKAITIIMLFSVAACNTTAGFGKDVESAGDAIENTAKDVSD